MKILWLNHRDIEHPRAGGAERTITEIGGRLVARGHEVHWIAPGWSHSAAESSVRGIRISRYRGIAGAHLEAILLLRGTSSPTHVVDDLAHVIPWGSPRVSSVPTLVFFHHLHARTLDGQVGGAASAVLKLLERSYSRLYRGATFVSESDQSLRDLEHLGISIRQTIKIPPGVDTRLFYPRARADPPYIIYFGGLRHYKRPEESVRAYARYRERGGRARLLVLGEGPCRKHVSAIARDLGISDQVEVLGRVSNSRLAELVAGATANIHSSVAEGWCFSAMEAAASGVPTVAYSVPGLRESVLDGETGRLVADGDSKALGDALLEVSRDAERWRTAAVNFAHRFSWDVAAESWERALLQVSRH